MARTRALALVVAAIAAGALIGLGPSHLISAPRGAEHSCSSGAPPAECSYPPNHAQWTVFWLVGGAVAGLIAGLLVIDRCAGTGRTTPRA